MTIGTNSPAFQLWVRLVKSHQRIRDAVDAAFRAADLPPLEWYDILLELERRGAPLRARDLEHELLLAQYNLSRLLDRLERRGLIIREPDPDDGRSRLIRLSAAGLAARRSMWPVYRQIVEQAVGGSITDDEALALAGQLAPLATAAGAKSPDAR